MSYCRRCGKELYESRGIYTCANNHTLFVNPIPTVSLFLINPAKTHVTLAIRGIEPGKGKLDAFGGFLNVGETAEQGQIRELNEELGISSEDIGPLNYISTEVATYRLSNEERPLLCIAYWATISDGVALTPSDDVADYEIFALDDVQVDKFAGTDNAAAFVKLKRALKVDKS